MRESLEGQDIRREVAWKFGSRFINNGKAASDRVTTSG
jgi:hypothetical protein